MNNVVLDFQCQLNNNREKTRKITYHKSLRLKDIDFS